MVTFKIVMMMMMMMMTTTTKKMMVTFAFLLNIFYWRCMLSLHLLHFQWFFTLADYGVGASLLTA